MDACRSDVHMCGGRCVSCGPFEVGVGTIDRGFVFGVVGAPSSCVDLCIQDDDGGMVDACVHAQIGNRSMFVFDDVVDVRSCSEIARPATKQMFPTTTLMMIQWLFVYLIHLHAHGPIVSVDV